MVTHRRTNRARHRVTSLITTNVLTTTTCREGIRNLEKHLPEYKNTEKLQDRLWECRSRSVVSKWSHRDIQGCTNRNQNSRRYEIAGLLIWGLGYTGDLKLNNWLTLVHQKNVSQNGASTYSITLMFINVTNSTQRCPCLSNQPQENTVTLGWTYHKNDREHRWHSAQVDQILRC